MARKRRGLPLSGWLVIDKPVGMTSSQVVGRVRRLTGAAKAGHAGTLDPLATGVLPVALGEATKTMPFVVDSTKLYRFTACWGAARTTDDAEGEVTQTCDHRPDKAAIIQALQSFQGEISQIPPAYSAIKVDGRRAYKAARAGENVELAPRLVEVHHNALVEIIDADHAIFEVESGKGFYVRSFVRDIAQKLGTCGYVSDLRRCRVGPFLECDAISLDKLEEMSNSAPPENYLLPITASLDDIPAITVTGPESAMLKHGQVIRVPSTKEGLICVMADGNPVALAQIENQEVRPVRVFNLSQERNIDVDYG